MVLSHAEIQAALDAGRLIVDPQPVPRQPTVEHPECPYSTSAVDLRLGSELAIPLPEKPFVFDLRRGGVARFLSENYRKVQMDPDGGFALKPNLFVLGNTVERVGLPLAAGAPGLAGRVEGKSSFARCGLIVHFTAPTIHAGFDGRITLEMINLGVYPIMLYPEMAICQLIVEEVRGTVQQAVSQYQGQVHPAGTG